VSLASDNKLLDLSFKFSVDKEANEASYWLKLMYETSRIDKLKFESTEKTCENIRLLLIATCRTAKDNMK
jgi:hypothetical protein